MCWWASKIAQLLWKRGWRFPKRLHCLSIYWMGPCAHVAMCVEVREQLQESVLSFCLVGPPVNSPGYPRLVTYELLGNAPVSAPHLAVSMTGLQMCSTALGCMYLSRINLWSSGSWRSGHMLTYTHTPLMALFLSNLYLINDPPILLFLSIW